MENSLSIKNIILPFWTFFGLSKRIYSDVLFSFIPGRGCLPHKEFLNQIKLEKLMHAFQLIAECNGPFYKDCHLQT